MIFVTGGCSQGKTAFALRKVMEGKPGLEGISGGGAEGDRKEDSAADGRTDCFEKAFRARLVLHFEWYVRRLLESGGSPEDFVRRLVSENSGAVVMADEIGSGIVPVEPFEREYREKVGRLCQEIAAKANEVYRVVCGIGMRLK